MKKLLPYLAAIILAFSFQAAEAQQKKFIDSSAIWIERFTEWKDGAGVMIQDVYTVYVIDSDTLIDQQRYGKIMKAGIYGQQLNNAQPPQLESFTWACPDCYVGAIRLDTAENKVYFRSKDASSATVLYDFDSVRNPAGVLITHVDSFLFEGRYYKQWGVNIYTSYGINELTGSKFSILDPKIHPFETEHRVYCVHSPRLGLVSDYCTENLSYVLSAKQADPYHLSLYPNPTKNSFTLHLPEPGEARLVICDAAGRILREETRLNDAQDWQVSCSELPAGVYLVQVFQRQNRYQGVLVKE